MNIPLIKAFREWCRRQHVSELEALIEENLHPRSFNLETACKHRDALRKLRREQDECCFAVKGIHANDDEAGLSKTCEVIGNIYENREFLTEGGNDE